MYMYVWGDEDLKKAWVLRQGVYAFLKKNN